MSTLFDLQQGERGIITKVRGRGAFRKRITEMGFVRGKEVTVVKSAPLLDPVEYKILGYNISLRHTEARLIEIIPIGNEAAPSSADTEKKHYNGTIQEETLRDPDGDRGKTIDVALVGNPNCGKTTLFNLASGSHERVGNFGGVTVDSKTATFRQGGYSFNITDLPGTYSLTAYSPEELYVRKHITDNVPDIVINIIDASNLERNLYLTTQLIDMDIRVVIALNMYDEFGNKGHVLDHKALGELLGIPVIPTIGSRGEGISELFSRVIDVFEDRDPVMRHVHINYGEELERSIGRIQEVIRKDQALTARISTRYHSIKLLEKDEDITKTLAHSHYFKAIAATAEKEIKRLEDNYYEDLSLIHI